MPMMTRGGFENPQRMFLKCVRRPSSSLYASEAFEKSGGLR